MLLNFTLKLYAVMMMTVMVTTTRQRCSLKVYIQEHIFDHMLLAGMESCSFHYR